MNRMFKALTLLFLGIVLTTGSVFGEGKIIQIEPVITLADGRPLDGKHSVTIRLYSGSEKQEWEEIHKKIRFRDGLAKISVGSIETLLPEYLDIPSPTLRLIIEGDEIEVPIFSSFLAVKAQSADHIDWKNVEGAEAPVIETLRFVQKNFEGVSGDITLNLDDASKLKLILAGDTTINFSTRGTEDYGHVMIIVKQDPAGGHTLSWPNNILWPMGLEPIMTKTPGAVDIFSFYFDGKWFIGTAGQNFKLAN